MSDPDLLFLFYLIFARFVFFKIQLLSSRQSVKMCNKVVKSLVSDLLVTGSRALGKSSTSALGFPSCEPWVK